MDRPFDPAWLITLTFAIVDSVGIPRSVGREQFCDLRHGQVRAPVAGCAFAERVDRIVVLIGPSHADRYVVVQAAWFASDMRQVSASWGFRFSS